MPSLIRKSQDLVFIFDIGGVVIKWPNNDPIFRYVGARYGVSFPRMKRAMHDDLVRVESGELVPKEYIAMCLGRVGKKIRRGDDPDKLLTAAFEKLAKPRLGTIAIIKSLKNRGYPVYALSNTSPPHVKVMKKRGWTEPLFDRFFASCELGMLKPEAEIFQRVMSEVGAKPRNVVFVDDNEANVRGALRAGIGTALRFQNLALLMKQVSKLLRSA